MEQVWVVLSYWYGLNDESTYGDDSKVERVVRGTYKRAQEVEAEIKASLEGKSRFCYTDIVESTLSA